MSNNYPIIGRDGLPYNYDETPILGGPDDFDTNAQSEEFLAIVRRALELGEDATPTEAQITLIKEAWQDFFYHYQPYIKDDYYESEQPVLDDPDHSFQLSTYFSDMFVTNYVNYRASGSTESFLTWADDNTDLQFRQRNVIFWQFYKLLNIITNIQDFMVNAVNRQTIFAETEKIALQNMEGVGIPSYKASDADYRVPDPGSVQSQHDAMQDIEGYRQSQKTSREKGRAQGISVNFQNDAQRSNKSQLVSFWDTLTRAFNNILN